MFILAFIHGWTRLGRTSQEEMVRSSGYKTVRTADYFVVMKLYSKLSRRLEMGIVKLLLN